MQASDRVPDADFRGFGSRRAAVHRAEAYMRAHVRNPLRVSSLCQLLGVSERGLRNAFYDVHGKSPKRWMLAMRLEQVRQALENSGTPAATVTGIATAYGFYDLGRFAVTYRSAFGEAPSATLRNASRKTTSARPPLRGDD
jgi:transcriptional regulator GlxA family with amidase domain